MLEDYITRWQLQGEAIPAPNGWTMDPDGYVTEHTDRAATQLEQLNALRTALCAPLHEFFTALDQAADAASCATAVYAYLTRIDLPRQLQARAALETERGSADEAAELIQLWNILLHALDQIVIALGDSPCTAADFTEALKLILSETDIGAIPTAADQVTVGARPQCCAPIRLVVPFCSA